MEENERLSKFAQKSHIRLILTEKAIYRGWQERVFCVG